MGFQFAHKTDRQPDRHTGTIAPKKSAPSLSPAQLVLPLQRSIGNRAVLRVLESRRIQPKNASAENEPSIQRKETGAARAWPDIHGTSARRLKGGGTRLARHERLPLIETLRHVLGPRRAPVGPPIQFALVDTLKGMLDIYGPVDYDGLIRAVRAAPVAERQAVLNDAATVSRIRSRFSGVWATSIMSSLLEGSQTWANPPATDFYAYFVTRSATGTPPSFSATMNCWESIMYAAYLAGVLSASWIKTYYVGAGAIPGTVTDPTPALWAQLGFSTSLPRYDPAATPPRVPSVGQLVFYLPSGAAIPAHVAVFMGGGEVVSLWTQPAGIRQVQRVPITSFAGTIYFGNAPW